MATTTVTMRPQTAAKKAKLPPENERFLRACSDIASALIQEYESQRDPTKPKRDINLNRLRAQMSKKHSLAAMPPLTAIIAAVPEHYKKYILPKLIAKPIRKGSTVRFAFRIDLANWRHRNFVWNCSCRRHVQAAPLPAYRLYREYLRVLPGRPRLRL